VGNASASKEWLWMQANLAKDAKEIQYLTLPGVHAGPDLDGTPN
jgi:hypothetical protein